MVAQLQAALTILRRKQAEARIGLSRSTIYGKLKFNPKRPNEFDPTFPKPIKLGPGAKAIGFIESEINAWLSAQVENSRKVQGASRSSLSAPHTELAQSPTMVPVKTAIKKNLKSTITAKG
jgi:prophage regulatory protein